MWDDVRAWLVRRGTPDNTAASIINRLDRLRAGYGNLAEQYRRDGLAGLVATLNYSTEDERRGRRNPSKVFINGNLRNGLASLKNAVSLYEQYMLEMGGQFPSVVARNSLQNPEPRIKSELPLPRLDGVAVLAAATCEMNLNLAELVARCSIWANPEVVAQLGNAITNATWFPSFRRLRSGEKRGETIDGVRLDDNSQANLAIKLAIFGGRKVDGFHACHVWPASCYDPQYHTSIANLVLLPAPLAGLSDFDTSVAASLRYRSFELFGWRPASEPPPERPDNYPAAHMWRETPAPSREAQRALSNRIASLRTAF